MTRRVRVPAPFQHVLPSIIRSAGPRVMLVAAGCAALLLVGGSSYLLSHTTPAPQPTPASPQQAIPVDNTPPGQVLGAATQPSATDNVTPASNGSEAPNGTPASPPTASTRSDDLPKLTPCTYGCSKTDLVTPAQPQPLPSTVHTDVLQPITNTLLQIVKLGTGLL